MLDNSNRSESRGDFSMQRFFQAALIFLAAFILCSALLNESNAAESRSA